MSTNPMSTPSKTKARRVKVGNHFVAWPWLFVAPAIILLIVFTYYPFFRALILSFQTTDLFGRANGFNGFDNFKIMLGSSHFWSVFGWTLVFTVVSTVLKIGLGMMIALALSYRLRGTMFMRSFVLIPMAVSTAVGTLIFREIFKPVVGAADQITSSIGLGTIPWFTDATWARVGVIVADIWVGISFVVLLLMAAIDGISEEVTEAASNDGCVGARYVRYMVIPLISPMLLFLVVTQSVGALREFTVIDALTGGGPAGGTTTLVFDMYQQAFGSSSNDFAGAAASGMVLCVIVVILSILQFRLSSKKVTY